ncbi:zinc metalloprotease [Nocardiopsis sp. MG754419]|uniref:zinc metalloprotease n=1 Tax=Nocardiopsis sp. MG754419 TaxID=2259865 RepID=UPI0035B267E3|nr:zinc metalloprotease [Nocardiopsis sp. MG754419]
MCGLALTGLVATTAAGPVQDRPAPTEASVASAATDPHCPPGTVPVPSAERRVAGPDTGTTTHEGTEVTPEQAAEYEGELRRAMVRLRGQEEGAAPPYTVPVVVHVISASDGSGQVSDERVDDQVDVLNRAYRGDYAQGSEGTDTGFRFELSEVTRTENDTWFRRFGEQRDTIRARLHQGGPETLNIYTADLGSGLLGFSTFPQDQADAPEQDGVAIAHDTLPGGDRDRFNEGHTGTHEVGHWLGLFHTFQNGCQSPGDYVDDTPYEREAASGCPVGRDSCPEREGKDPVTNFMNYSDDACMTHFTPGQAERMVAHWAAFRGGDALA